MKRSTETQFLKQFAFNPERRLYLGAEEELLLLTPQGAPAPESPKVLDLLRDARYTYELSACQVEFRTPPLPSPRAVVASVAAGRRKLSRVVRAAGLRYAVTAIAPASMPVAVYPDERYLHSVVPGLTPAQLLAACRVMGTHIHVGCANAEDALRMYNALVRKVPYLLSLCPKENEERLRLYGVVQPNKLPPVYGSVREWHAQAVADGFSENSRNCWHLVRISRHGTVEVRLFPATKSLRNIAAWAEAVQDIARGA